MKRNARTRTREVIPLAEVGWDPVFLDDESVSLAELTRERLLEECDRRDDRDDGMRHPHSYVPHIRIGVDREGPRAAEPPTKCFVGVFPGIVGEFTDREYLDGSSPPRWIHWIRISVDEVRAVLEKKRTND